jgi:hypothetical protein
MSGNEPVSIEALNAALADLEREVRALSKAQEPTAQDAPKPSDAMPSTPTGQPESGVAHVARTVAEDTVAASFVATESTIDRAAGWFVTLAELGAIHNDQAKALLKDSLDTLRALRNAHSPNDVLRATFDHWQRRAAHITDGLNRATDVITRETRRASASIGEMWRPVIDLVRADARRR